MNEDLCFMTIAEASRLIKARKLSPVELVRACLDRIEALEPQVSAFITRTGDLALKQARKAEREIAAGDYRGPMHGIPFALKDIYDTKGILTSGGSRVCQDNVPARDSTCTRKLYEAGGVLMGKLMTHEFAHGGPSFDVPWPPSRNPWNLEHFTGGSSSGSGAAVAAGFVPIAMGSDTGGSIRGPSSFCGITGMYGTSGLISRAGVIPNSFTLDHCGPMTRSAEDCAIVMHAIAGYDPADGGSVPAKIPNYRAALKQGVKGLRVGILRHVWEKDVPQSPEVCKAMDEAVDTLRRLGAKVEEVQVRPGLEYSDVKVVIAETEIFSINYKDLATRPGDFGEDFLSRILPACLFQSVDYLQATREHRRMLEEGAVIWKRYDALLNVVFGPAPRIDAHNSLNFWAKPNANPMGNILAGPAIAICNGFSAKGLPLGMQLMGRPFGESEVLRIAHAYEQATQWSKRRPQLTPGTPQPPVNPPRWEPETPADLDAGQIDVVRKMVAKAKLPLNDRQMAILMAMAPHALAMADRVRRMHERSAEPANVLRFPGSGS